jgi:hypothetical protein
MINNFKKIVNIIKYFINIILQQGVIIIYKIDPNIFSFLNNYILMNFLTQECYDCEN